MDEDWQNEVGGGDKGLRNCSSDARAPPIPPGSRQYILHDTPEKFKGNNL